MLAPLPKRGGGKKRQAETEKSPASSSTIFEKADRLVAENRVQKLTVEREPVLAVSAEVEGNTGRYSTFFSEEGECFCSCTSYRTRGGICSHILASQLKSLKEGILSVEQFRRLTGFEPDWKI